MIFFNITSYCFNIYRFVCLYLISITKEARYTFFLETYVSLGLRSYLLNNSGNCLHQFGSFFESFYFMSFSPTIITSVFLYNLVIPKFMFMDLISCSQLYFQLPTRQIHVLTPNMSSMKIYFAFQTFSASFILIYLNSKMEIHPVSEIVFLLISMCLDLSCPLASVRLT